MRKFLALCSFLCGVIFAGGAYAANESDCYSETNDAFGVDGARAIQIYFDVDKVNEKSGCKEYFEGLKSSLNNLATSQDIAGFIVLGSASRSSSNHKATTAECQSKLKETGNIALACDRAEFVLANIIPDNVRNNVQRGNNAASGLSGKKVLVLNMSDTNDRTYLNTGDANQQTEISTTVLVIPKGVTCNDSEKLKNAQKIMEKYENDKNFPNVCKTVLTYCPDGEDLHFVTKEEFGNIEECMGELAKLGFDTGDWDLWVKIDGLYKKLDGLLAGLSVWKNAEGKFNTSRLLSDSVAAVVLGTTSGVITSTLVKKNQIKKGFESLRCMVGGQPVADYGDEFVVGATATAYSR
ncbi:MAG: hypothetical protein K6B71_00305 [Alphaproteobacteria bacterium]|nr:hypothetical protein [Alphaproteobacteria bacterium]